MTTLYRFILLTLVVIFQNLSHELAFADIRDPFESPDPVWKLALWDGHTEVLQHERDFRVAHSGQGSEFVRLATQGGSYAYLAYEISPVMLIDELAIGVWIRADQPGLQLAARLVLPHTRDPRTGRPLTVLLAGTTYQQTGNWQELSLTALRRQFALKRPALLDKHGANVDLRQAFVDRILLNAHGGKTVTQVWIDDLEVVGDVHLENAGVALETIRLEGAGNASNPGVVRTADGTSPTRQLPGLSAYRFSPSPARVAGTQFLVKDRPFLPLIARWHGEPMTAIKELGFNTVWLDALPPPHVLQEVERLNLWLLVPYDGVHDDRLYHARTLAWSIDCRNAADFRVLRQQLRQIPPDSRRPFFIPPSLAEAAEPEDVLWQQSSESSGEFAAGGNPVWVERGLIPGSPYETRRQVFESVLAGTRGLIIDCQITPAASGDTYRERLVVQKILQELALVEPWIAGGNGCERLGSDEAAWQRGVLPAARSRLIVAIRQPSRARAGAGPLTVIDPGSAASYDAYQLTDSRLVPLRRQRVAGGVRVDLADPDDVSLIVFTQDPATVNYLGRRLAEQVRTQGGLLRR